MDGDDVEQAGGGSWLTATLSNAAVSKGYLQTITNADHSIVSAQSVVANGDVMAGPVLIDSTGVGCMAAIYQNNLYVLGINSSYAYDGANAEMIVGAGVARSGQKVWLELNRATNAFKARFSINGYTWSPYTGTISKTITVDRTGILRIFGSPTVCQLSIDRFNKTA